MAPSTNPGVIHVCSIEFHRRGAVQSEAEGVFLGQRGADPDRHGGGDTAVAVLGGRGVVVGVAVSRLAVVPADRAQRGDRQGGVLPPGADHSAGQDPGRVDP